MAVVLTAAEPPAGPMLLAHLVVSGTTMVRVCTDALGTTEPSSAAVHRRFSAVRTFGGIVPVLYAAWDTGTLDGLV